MMNIYRVEKLSTIKASKNAHYSKRWNFQIMRRFEMLEAMGVFEFAQFILFLRESMWCIPIFCQCSKSLALNAWHPWCLYFYISRWFQPWRFPEPVPFSEILLSAVFLKFAKQYIFEVLRKMWVSCLELPRKCRISLKTHYRQNVCLIWKLLLYRFHIGWFVLFQTEESSCWNESVLEISQHHIPKRSKQLQTQNQ